MPGNRDLYMRQLHARSHRSGWKNKNQVKISKPKKARTRWKHCNPGMQKIFKFIRQTNDCRTRDYSHEKVNKVSDAQYVGAYLYLCICIYVSVFVYLYLFICICVYVFVYLYLCICICVFVKSDVANCACCRWW